MADVPPRNPMRDRPNWIWASPGSVFGKKRSPRCSYCRKKLERKLRAAYKRGAKKVACEACVRKHGITVGRSG
jgi:hypothetical protein